MRQQIIKGFMLCTAVFMTACMASSPTKKATGDKPDWIINEPTRSGHAYGVGSAEIFTDEAEALIRARNTARVAMVQKLRVTVSGSFSQDTQETRKTGQQTELVRTVRNTIGSQIPEAEFNNLAVEDSYVDPDKGIVYSLVRLDRVKETSQIRRQISELDSDIIAIRDETSGSLPTLKQLQALLPALKLISKREKLADRAQLVDVNSRRPAKDAAIKNLESRIESLLDQLVVTVEAKNSDAKGMRSGIVKSLTDIGIRVSRSNPDISLIYDAQLRPIEKNGRFIVFAGGSIQIRDASGRILSDFSKETKGLSGASEALAEQHAIQKLAASLGRELAATLVDKID